jgi:hypothetical protein
MSGNDGPGCRSLPGGFPQQGEEQREQEQEEIDKVFEQIANMKKPSLIMMTAAVTGEPTASTMLSLWSQL